MSLTDPWGYFNKNRLSGKTDSQQGKRSHSLKNILGELIFREVQFDTVSLSIHNIAPDRHPAVDARDGPAVEDALAPRRVRAGVVS